MIANNARRMADSRHSCRCREWEPMKRAAVFGTGQVRPLHHPKLDSLCCLLADSMFRPDHRSVTLTILAGIGDSPRQWVGPLNAVVLFQV